MTNALTKSTSITILPERAAQAAIQYAPAKKAYTATKTEIVCQFVTKTTGGNAPSLTKTVTIVGGKAVVSFVQIPGKPGVTTTTRVCAPVTTTVSYPAMPEQKAQPSVTYRPRTVVQEFGLGWNAGARSIAELAGNGSATFKVPSATGAVVGFNDVDEDEGYLNIEHGIYFRRQTFQPIELGELVGAFATFVDTDTFKIERIGSRVRYFKNDSLVYTSLAPSTGTVFLDASLYSGGDTIDSPALMSTGPAGGYSAASMRPMDGFASETEWNYSRGVMLAMTGTASALRSRSHGAMRPITGLATQGKYGDSRAVMRPMTGVASAGMLAPAYGLSAAQMMPMYGYAHGPEPRYGKSNAVMYPMLGMATDKKYGSSNAIMAPMEGYSIYSLPSMTGVLGGNISHFAIVTLQTAPMVGMLGGGFMGALASVRLPTGPSTGILGGAITQFAETTLKTTAMRGILGGSITPQAKVVLQTVPMPLMLGGDLGALSRLLEVFAMNLQGAGTTQYRNYPFNSVAKIGGRYYGASADGLFLLEGDDDNGEPIEAVFGLGQLDFGNAQVKNVPYCYLGAAAGAMRLEIDALIKGQPASFTYPAREHGASMRGLRFDLGKGMRSSYVVPTFYNSNGEPFEVDSVRFLVADSARRI